MNSQQRIGFRKSTDRWKQWRHHIHRGFLLLMLLLVGFLHTTHLVQDVRNGNVSFTSIMPEVAAMSAGLDPQFANFLHTVGLVANRIDHQRPLFPDLADQISDLFAYGRDNGSWSSKWFAERYPVHRELFTSISQYEDDLRSLLGEQHPQQYLVVLQNTAEKRPNGGFFGSFGLIEVTKGRITNFAILDSYLPAYDNPDTYITGPRRLLNFLPERKIYFIGANKIGFTYHDGAHIQLLYEKSYPGQQIRGVIFVSTDMFKELIPGFRRQLREWQFVNAAVDLIRGADRWGKKELYLAGSQRYFQEHKSLLLQSFAKKLPDLIEQRYINVYLDGISQGLHRWIRDHQLTTRFEADHGYFRDSNISFNKSDVFVDKVIQIVDEQGRTRLETTDEIVSFTGLGPGQYEVSIYYQLHVPSSYHNYIKQLEDDYQITLGEREEHILVMDPERATRGLIYLPPTSIVTNLRGDLYEEELFTTPFARGVSYKSAIDQNNQVNIISFTMTLPDQ